MYLLFAYARVASILRKAADERGVDVAALGPRASTIITVEEPSERALVFELLQLGDVLQNVLSELLPNRLCDYLR